MTRAVFFGSSDSVFSHRHFQALLQADCRVAGVVDVPPAAGGNLRVRRVRTAEGHEMSAREAFLKLRLAQGSLWGGS
jgi:hypothetical protein